VPSNVKVFLTPEQYLEMERKSETKNEYLNGEVFAMTGASRWHNRIVINLVYGLESQLHTRPCSVYSNDLRVKVQKSGLYTSPDIVVGCGEEKFEDEHLDTLLNPLLVIEVLSDSTEAYDRGAKFAHYQQIDSLMEYLLIAQERYSVEQYVRHSGKEWLYSIVTSADGKASLKSIECELKLAEIYFKVPGLEASSGPAR
jgi:Uma2 family endonuclease